MWKQLNFLEEKSRSEYIKKLEIGERECMYETLRHVSDFLTFGTSSLVDRSFIFVYYM